jgi:FlaA1/EpsC-like NDP-sugar epimerase
MPALSTRHPALQRLLLQSRRPLSVALHMSLIVGANTLAFLLRFDGDPPATYWRLWLAALPWLVAARVVMFMPLRLYASVWRYTSISDLRNIVLGVVGSSVMFGGLGTMAGVAYPRSIILIDAVVLICLMSGTRLSRHVYRELRTRRGNRTVLIYGAGDAGAQIVQNMTGDPVHGYRPIGFVDDNPAKVGGRIHGVPVLGTRYDLDRILESNRPDEVVIAIPNSDPEVVRALVRVLEPFKIPIKTLPNLREIVDGRVDVRQIRGLAIEDLLPRAPVGLDQQPLHGLIQGKRVMVTGAGGSIGAELCRQIAGLKPATLVMLDRYENTLHHIRLELEDLDHAFRTIAVIADVTDAFRVNAVIREQQPEIIFHAAAHKHVPLMEENPCEAVKNNVRGTRILAQAADAHGVDRFVMISTDKAVNPTSVMGASKRVAELIVQAQAVGSGTSFCIVRFGNVLGSNGSVVPRFVEQIGKGGPVTVTHPDIRRFFMLIPEAVQLVLHAASQAESGATYVLEMGEQVKLVDLAKDLIRLSGLVPDEDIKIIFTGLRPGEKLYEELVGAQEDAQPSAVAKILCVRARRRPDGQLFTDIALLEDAASTGQSALVLLALKELVGTCQRAGDAQPEAAPPTRIADAGVARIRTEEEQPCPACHHGRAHRSRARSLAERIKKDFTAGRLFRCEACGWRGWLEPLHADRNGPGEPLPTPDLDSVDALFTSNPVPPRPSFSPRNLS